MRGGEIVGIAGITGNGQSEFLRSLAGLLHASGEVTVGEKPVRLGHPEAAHHAGIVFLSADRHEEGLFMRLSVRENAALAALRQFAWLGIVRARVEQQAVEEQSARLDIRTPSIEANVAGLSGGNQQKVVLARALLAQAAVVLAEEPTAGVDVGARSEIYRILRDVADHGTPVLIVSSDTLGTRRSLRSCRGVFARPPDRRARRRRRHGGEHRPYDGHGHGAPKGGKRRRQAGQRRAGLSWGWRARQFASGDYAPSVVLAILVPLIGAYATNYNARFVSAFNIEKIFLLSAALSFIGFGQVCAIFTGGIDVSVGPLTGLTVVIASFFFVDGASFPIMFVGLVAMFGAGPRLVSPTVRWCASATLPRSLLRLACTLSSRDSRCCCGRSPSRQHQH